MPSRLPPVSLICGILHTLLTYISISYVSFPASSMAWCPLQISTEAGMLVLELLCVKYLHQVSNIFWKAWFPFLGISSPSVRYLYLVIPHD